VAGETNCPNCGAEIPVPAGTRAWCERCDWNVGGETPDLDETFFERQYARISQRHAKATLATLKATPVKNLRPRWTVRKVTAFGLAASVHLLTLILLVTGIGIVVTGFPAFASIFWGAVLCAFVWLMRPKPGKVPARDLADRKNVPALHAFVNQVAKELRGRPVSKIVVDESFNAAYGVFGWRRVPVLWIGLPLWMALRPQERLALIGHEIAHGVNGDGTRGFIIGSALSALDEWIGLLQAPLYQATSIAQHIAGFMFWILSIPFAAVQSLLAQLLWLDKQQAEYFADFLASTVSGTEATVSWLQRMGCAEHLDDVLLRNAYSTSQSGARILGLFRERIASLPDREWQRLARASQREGARLDATHPPTAFRIEFLKAHVVAKPRMIATEDAMRKIDAELTAVQERLGKRLIARYARD
jgi:Zn-dependent protease with chaperone function